MAESSQELLKGLGFETDPMKAQPAQLVGEGELARAKEREVTERFLIKMGKFIFHFPSVALLSSRLAK